ncbi:MAG TPA: O-methyltransferase, partial [Ardenticatenaceae bacterium]
MSGENVAYNLRPNKFVERQLFVELLSKLGVSLSPAKYIYISLGGLQLEDHRLMHHSLGINALMSIESDFVTYQRQLFNLRPSFVNCECMSTEDLVNDFDRYADLHSDKQFIIWLDYADASKRVVQLTEYAALLSKLQVGDILKITMNANPRTLGAEQRKGEEYEDLLKRRLGNLKSQLNKYLQVQPPV